MSKQSAISYQQLNPPIPPLAKGGKGGFEAGFTLVELLITMTVFVLVIAAASNIFSGLLTQFKQQSKITETNIEGIVGLEILRQDIGHAGYGLPWNVVERDNTTGNLVDTNGDGNRWDNLANYTEADSIACTPNTNDFDDAPNSAPRAILSRNNATFSGCGANSIFNSSDYLVIKSANIARNDAAGKYTNLSSTSPYTRTWTPSSENLATGDRVTVISPGATTTNSRSLIVSSGAWYTQYSAVNSFKPNDNTDVRVVYGVDGDTNLRMPFNRADYYIWRGSTSSATDEVPDRCATNTGVLRKAVISQSNGQRMNPLPLLDCVADMQVIYQLDMNDDGTIGTQANADGSSVSSSEGATSGTVQATLASASLLRQRLKEVRAYILAHEGQRDVNYTYPNAAITVGEFGLGRNFNLTTITNYQNYRWKVYTIVVKPKNLE